ncbi:phospholipase D-like domain-containing protein [Paraburkholderia adhaesiva]|uniref:phospholipase D-like domain-containing protein n=1 Tax=Paraburkholderia adhaesiva TaxID=2883244 RepID=UPI001F409CDD|nr:phospholipase D-like domain-containing protein [Paraburkholderia adhaesiva]
MTNLKTQNPVDVAIAEAGRQAQGSVQWLLETRTCKDAPETTLGNQLDFFICGEDGFRELSRDLLNATRTVDLVCWGFDPGMELVRSADKWHPGKTYGDLLEQIAKKGVRVRLLLWYDDTGSFAQNNMPGYTNEPVSMTLHPQQYIAQTKAWGLGDPYGNPERHQYCKEWWSRNLPGGPNKGVGKGENPNLQIMPRGINRDITSKDVDALLKHYPEEKVMPSDEKIGVEQRIIGSEYDLLTKCTTHHQKPVLIDYNYNNDGGNQAVGYVMGLNSVTDFWDTKSHEIDTTSRRETSAYPTTMGEIQHEYESDVLNATFSYQESALSRELQEIHSAQFRSLRPYQDYACRICGPALKRLHENFEVSWNYLAHRFAPLLLPVAEHTVAGPANHLPPPKRQPGSATGQNCKVQIVRTQPREQEKTIKKLYLQSTSIARDYIYIENQYFFYPEFAQQLKIERQTFCDKWAALANKPLMEVPALHLFIVIPHPERDQMIPRTFDTVTELGASDQMPGQAKLADAGKASHDNKGSHQDKKGNKVLDRASVQALQKTLGLKVSVARLCTSGAVNGNMAYREIYIHSKLMIIDDVFLTLGSANINQRSMSADSEINIAVNGAVWPEEQRREVFKLHSGNTISGDGGRREMPQVYKDWNKLANINYQTWKTGEINLTGFLVKFEDMRKTDVMYASVTVPSLDYPTAVA